MTRPETNDSNYSLWQEINELAMRHEWEDENELIFFVDTPLPDEKIKQIALEWAKEAIRINAEARVLFPE